MYKKHPLALAGLASILATTASSQGALLAYWDQNSNSLPNNPSSFGFITTAFPQSADQGSGSLSLADFDTTTVTIGGTDEVFDYIESFGGTDLNAQPSIVAGGSLSPQGGASNSNNGMSIILRVSTSGFTDVVVSWDQRGTATGFTSRAFDYSTDGINWTNFDTDSGALTSTWVTEEYDLSAISAIEDQSSVYFRIVLDGATATTGNNRFDNLTVTAVPEPTVALLGAFGLLGLVRRRR